MNKTIVFHCGFHKIGSTLIQNTLAANPSMLQDMGVSYVTQQTSSQSPFLQANLVTRKGKEVHAKLRKQAVESFHHFVQSASGRTVIFSREGFLGGLRDFYAHCNICLKFLNELTRDFRVKYVCYVKRQDKVLESQYAHMVRVFHANTNLQKFLNEYDYRKCSWLRVLSTIEGAVGQVNLIVKRSDRIGAAQTFVKGFVHACCRQTTLCDFFIPEDTNQSYNHRQLTIKAFLNAALPSGIRRNPQVARSIHTLLSAPILRNGRRAEIQ